MPTIVKEVAKTWHGSLPQLVTLVGVEPALHDHNRHPIQLTKEKPATSMGCELRPTLNDPGNLPTCPATVDWGKPGISE